MLVIVVRLAVAGADDVDDCDGVSDDVVHIYPGVCSIKIRAVQPPVIISNHRSI